MKNKYLILVSIMILTASCISTKSTLKNVDDNAPIPRLTTDNTFLINISSQDKKYGYEKDYPINVFYRDTKDESINQMRFLNALAGPAGEKITYEKIETCCPFPTKRNEIGAGFLDVYELRWPGQKSPVKLYLNMHEKGVLMVPFGLTLKKK